MTKSKNTKRALLMSALSMMLCIAMLAGTTFAWFTDTVTSGMNKIVAGNLDIELEYATEFNEDGTVKTWTPVDPEKPLFSGVEKDGVTDNLWEPGHTEYVCLRVRNAGTLALKYLFSINVFGDENGGAENEYTNVYNEKFKLSKYLVFNQVAYEKEEDLKKVSKREDLWLDRDKEQEAMGKLDDLGLNGELLETDEAKVMMLAVYMPTQVGNEANQLTSKREEEGAPTIYLGLNVQATQTPYESDSFDNKYDDNILLNAPPRLTDTNGTSYSKPVKGEDGKLTFTPVPVDGEDTPGITFTADPETKELTLTSGMDYSGDVKLPAAITGEDGTVYTLTAIADSAIGNPFSTDTNQNITSVTIPDTVESIGEYAFAGCTNLKSVTIPNSVTTISEGAFSEVALEEVTLPESITAIPTAAFSGCDKLTTVKIPNSITEIGNLAFSKCTALTSITIPESVTSIGNSAFNGSGLESVTIPASVTTLGTRVFSGCESLTQLVIPNTVTKMGSLYFQGCENLKELVLPACVKLVPPGAAFMGCDSLENIYYFAAELKSSGTYSRQNNSAFERAAKYVYSETQPDDLVEKPTVTVKTNSGTIEFEYWYWHMVEGVPTAWPFPGT